MVQAGALNRIYPPLILFILALIQMPTTIPLHAAPSDLIIIEKLSFQTLAGRTLEELGINQQVLISSTLHNNENRAFKYFLIVDLRTEDDISVNIIVNEGEIAPKSIYSQQVSWKPDKVGSYSIRAFVISNFDTPEILSDVISKSVVVGEESVISSAKEEPPIDPPTESVDDSGTPNDAPSDYTVMVYMVASDLESRNYAATSDIDEMLEAEIKASVNVVIQTGGSRDSTIDDVRFIDFTKVQRFEITDHEAKLVMDLGAQNMGDSDTLKSFVGWAATGYPAEKYVLIMWDHGNGIRGFGYDDIYGDSLSILEIKEGLKESARFLELLGFDGCLMATLEVATQLSSRAHYLVASQEVEPEWGWDYETILSSFGLAEGESIDGKELGIIIADSYVEHSREKASVAGYDLDRYVTLSVVDLTKVVALSSNIKDMGDDLGRFVTELKGAQTFAKMARYTERYGTDYEGSSGYADLYQMADNAEKLFPSLAGMGGVVKSSLDAAVVYNVRGEARPNAHGLSIFLQLDEYESGQEYLTYLVPEWLLVIEGGARTLALDDESPSGWMDYSSGRIEGEIEDEDVSHGSISIYQEMEDSSKYRVVSYSKLDSSEFLGTGGKVEYELNDLISLCNEDACVSVFVLFENYEDSLFAYFPVRLVSEEENYDEHVTLIYEIKDNDFIFIGAWEGYQDETAQRGLRALNDGDKIFTLMYELDDEDQDYFEEIENEPIEVTNGFGPKYESLAGEYTFQMSVCDYAGNCISSEVFDLA